MSKHRRFPSASSCRPELGLDREAMKVFCLSPFRRVSLRDWPWITWPLKLASDWWAAKTGLGLVGRKNWPWIGGPQKLASDWWAAKTGLGLVGRKNWPLVVWATPPKNNTYTDGPQKLILEGWATETGLRWVSYINGP